MKKNSATRVPGAVWTMSYGFKRPIDTLISIVLLKSHLRHTMRNSLLDSHPCPLFIIKRSEGKREGAGLLLNLGKDGSGSLHLELVVGVASLVDGCAGRVRLGLGEILAM